MSNRFYTILIVPEKTSQVRKIVLPGWVLKGAAIGVSFIFLIAVIMILDYWYVMSQISENKQLKMDNRRLRQQVQIYKNKMTTIESTMERIKTFATRLKVITNIEDRNNLLQTLNNQLPDASTNIANNTSPTTTASPIPGATTSVSEIDTRNPEEAQLRKENDQMDAMFAELNQETLYLEQMLQDQYELLADQKSFLAALPTRKPAVGYFTSGFGVRRSPYGGKVKMHEGLDIANHPGTVIKSPADGIITFAEAKAGYGQTIIIDHGYGVETWYGHNKKLIASKGQRVRRGDSIAILGNTGRSTGPHLHYEVRINGIPVDPKNFILEN